MAYNKAREEKKWRLWKEAEEKQLRSLGVSEKDIEKLRVHDWAIFNSDRRYYQRMQETGTYLMSSIAQEESRKTSERVKWGQKRQMEQGVVFGRSMLGYDVDGGKMTINEEGAKVVRLIFHKFVNEGKGTHVIARELREEGISPMRVKEWSNTVILRVIRNEKYCGDLVQKKTYTPDFLSHEKKYNRGQEEFVIIKDHHEPIISRELFDEANRILDAKSLSQEGKAKHSNRYPFSGKIKCGCCGSSYVARYKTRKDGSRYKAWRCNEAAKHGSPHIDKAGNQVGCTGLSIRNEDATHIMYLVTKSLKYNRNKIINNLTAVIQSIIAMDTTGTDVLKLQEQIKKIEGKRARASHTFPLPSWTGRECFYIIQMLLHRRCAYQDRAQAPAQRNLEPLPRLTVCRSDRRC